MRPLSVETVTPPADSSMAKACVRSNKVAPASIARLRQPQRIVQRMQMPAAIIRDAGMEGIAADMFVQLLLRMKRALR